MKELIEAVNKVMESVENVDKSMTIGSGNHAYKGVSDKDVKLMFNRAMRDNGLAIFTTKIEPTTTVERWEETTNYGVKQKQSVFTEVLVTYELHHISGQSIKLQGYGHGVDPQDKAAGKATTYALKYALLYNFLVATGQIDDSDAIHSNAIETPKAKPTQTPKSQRVIVTEGSKEFDAIIDWIIIGKKNKDGKIVKGTLEKAKEFYNISDNVEESLKASLKEKITDLADFE